MNTPIQSTLDTSERLMREASTRVYSAPAGTRVLHSLVTVFAQPLLNDEQMQQLEVILELHEACMRGDGKTKYAQP